MSESNDVNEMMAILRLEVDRRLYGDHAAPARSRTYWRLARLRSRIRDAWDVLLGRAFIE